ncbi:MAG TPA: oligosaccharide flippase family protein [Flavitalea sp.]|nr:oligosaccharide flippase family protein [Flavitalea sp.]
MQQVFGAFLRFLKFHYQNNLFINRISSVLAIDMLVKLSGFILIPIYLRLMNQAEFGLYNYLLSILATFSLVLNFGLYMPLAKMYHDASDTYQKGRLLFTISCTLISLMFLIITPLYLFKADYFLVNILFKNKFDYGNYRMIIIMALCITILSFMLTNYFFSTEKISAVKKYNLSRIIIVNIAVLTGLYFTSGDKVHIRLAITYIVELLIFFAFIYFLVKETVPVFDIKIATQALKLGWPIMLSAMLGIVINFSDKFFLEKFGGFTELSSYYLAASFAGILSVIVASIQNAWLPLFMKEKDLNQNVAKTKKLVKQLFFIFLGISIGIYLLFYILIRLGIIPQKYFQVLFILPILLITQIFSSMTPFLSNYLVYFQKTYLVSLAGLIVCCVSLGASYYLVPRWGVYGAASAALVSNFSYLLLYYFIVKKIINKYFKTQYP